MSYDAALEVQNDVQEMLRWDKSVLMVSVGNKGGKFCVTVGSLHPDDVEVPKELDGVAIDVIKMDMPSAFEPRD